MNSFGIFLYLFLSIPVLVLGFKTLNNSVFISVETKRNSPGLFQEKRWILWLIVFFMLLWILPYFIQTLLPNTDWDGAWQHLPLPKLFLERGIAWVDPSFMQYNFPGAVHLVYSLFIFIKAESAVIPFNFIIAIGIIVSVYFFADHFFGKHAALWAASIAAAINIMWEVSLTPRIDSFLTLFCLLAMYSFLLWIQDSKRKGLLIITGMLLGMAMGTKYTAAVFVGVLCLFGIIHFLMKYKMNSINNIVIFLITLATLLLPSGWWYARNTIKLGDPVYPFMSGDMFYDSHGNKIELYTALHKHLESMPSREEIEAVLNETGLHLFTDYEERINRKADRTSRIFKMSRTGLLNIWDILINPDEYSRKPYHEITPILLFFILLPFFDRSKISLYLYGISGFIFVFFATKTHILRYALPVFPLFSIGAARVLSNIHSKKIIVAMILISGFFLFRFSFLETKKLIEMKPLSYLSGNEEKIDWLENIGYNWDRTTPPFIKFVNQQIDNGSMKKEDIILMVGEGKGNLLNCNYLPDSSRSARLWLEELIKGNNDYAKIAKSLRERGVGYFAINYFYLYWAYSNSRYGTKALIFGLYHLQRFLETHTEIIYNDSGIVVAKIK
jgi:hypothetical protein